MTATTRRAGRERTRQKLLEAATKLFAEAGYSNTSVDQIAKEAACTKGAFYVNFKNKEEILLHAIKADQEDKIELLAAEIARAAEASEIVGLLVQWAGEKSATRRLTSSVLEQARMTPNALRQLRPYEEEIGRKWGQLAEILASRFPHLANKNEHVAALLYQITYVSVPSYVSRSNAADTMRVAVEGLLRVPN